MFCSGETSALLIIWNMRPVNGIKKSKSAGAGIWTRVESLEGSRARPDYTTPAYKDYVEIVKSTVPFRLSPLQCIWK